MKKERLALLLEKFENGTCSESERAELNQWYHSFSQEERQLEQELKHYPDFLNTLKLTVWAGIEDKLPAIGEPSEPKRTRRLWAMPFSLPTIAALVVLGIFLTLAYLKHPANTIGYYTVTTRLDHQSKVTLSDGSIIWVKPGSTLRYPKSFDSLTREVFLNGEAYFDVAHDDKKVFLVHTSDITIKVLGTEFNVRSFKDQETIETTLVRGKVQIERDHSSKGQDVILAPRERAVYDKQSGAMDIEQSVDVRTIQNNGSFAQSLVFDETPFSTVFPLLEKRYGVKIHVEEDNLSCKLTADVEKENLEEILRLLEVSHRIQYRIVGKDVYITGKLCH
ncbi:ferric-dicitrate binding protein FerR (iron transport regulator) [Dyadobacter jejuensis]|uniref:Ferric-dicitrate binding protein FerR (Iron transport regulator) n=1 Tax=Dyadobacter jejuensis TaxID=1082580 RepID=A0A316AAB5_9BACT|nr:FecR domain-containing protein [Dyadobacter jejuensis]PWJ54482.1 ferric-dicitrate binding protein FerR (iron transport regulator) [Dyadobacter jejuensis]